MPQIVIFDVDGMTCRSCEQVIGDALREIPGVIEVEVSLKQQRAAIRFKDAAAEPACDAVNERLKAHGYVVFPRGERPTGCSVGGGRDPLKARLGRAIAVLGIAVAVLLVASPLRGIVPSIGAGASIGAMFGLGVIASLSSCLASTGGFMLAASARDPSRRRTILMHIGRLAMFALGGVVLGASGSGIPSISSSWYGVFALVLGIGFLMVGLQLLDLAPPLSRLGIALPSRLHRVGDRVAESRGAFAPLLIGAVTFILPCGFTQTAQALALASGSATSGLLMLIAFSLGTLPVLLGISWFGTAATLRHRMVRLLAGAVLVLFAFGQIEGGLTILGSPVTAATIVAPFRSKDVSAAIPDGEEQVIRMTVAYGTFQPKNLNVRSGIPVRWDIDGQDVSGCASSIVVPSYGIKKELIKGLNVIRFTPTQIGTIPFSCGMGMIRGTITVL
ncbi:sulfite exporter TauE/SafE family protein [Patescibacteria group bacterium]|nr:sulfite exporter TauE/SafE family protein [Patescibacteria group bacterium]MBU1448898.1 sulfite exporter TauE/SafE family protein [Patescibacteria group bacterium]MBU2613297.1 sulfite exporter TauE/SafE family protein [Patescibacteria group bacterium]